MKNKKTLKILGILALIITLIGGFISYKRHESREKYYALYRHGFQLLEEQIAYYIVENYSGISKIEFSPIFMWGGGGHSPLTLNVVTKIYDNHGNHAIMSGQMGEIGYGAYGTSGSLSVSLDIFDKHIIYLKTSDGDQIDVSRYKHLPGEAKLTENAGEDEIITWLVENNKLEDIVKDKSGSPNAKIHYNLEIKRGEWWKWR